MPRRPSPRSTVLALSWLALVLLAGSPFAAARQLADTTGTPPAPLVVMNLAAHPDDEDGRTLAYYRGAKNAVAYSVIFTRGEGGQNEIGPELYEELGAIRTEETERAARILGTQVFFLNYEDFGYSKFAEEAFARWGGRDAVTAELVHLIRRLKPDVLFTNHDTVTVGPRRQHGQHQAVGIAAYDAFELAADPTYHPEQLDDPGVDLWQPKRLFLRYWRRPDDFDVKVPVGAVDERTGKPYTEIAGEALGQHASQGMDFFIGRRFGQGDPHTYFTLLRRADNAPLDSLDLAAGLPPNTAAEPDLTYLIDAGRLPVVPDSLVTVDDPVAVPGQEVTLSWNLRELPMAETMSWDFEAPAGSQIERVAGTPMERPTFRLRVSPEATPTLPKPIYQYERIVSRPPVRYAIRNGAGRTLAAGYVPLEIAPAVTIHELEPVVRLHPGDNALAVHGDVFAHTARTLDLMVDVVGADDWRIAEQRVTIEIEPEAAYGTSVPLTLPDDLPPGPYRIDLTARLADAPVARRTQPARVLEVDVAEGLRVGVVESYDNTLAQALRELGAEPVLLDADDLANGAYADLHTVVVDIRAYLVRQDLREANPALLDWVRDGGHLVVNYQKTFEWNAESDDPFEPGRKNPGNFAPYPLELGRDRVTFEDAPVTILRPDHVLFHAPNQLGDEAWDDWVQERGLYFPETYDDRYVELFSMADPGEEPLSSSTLLAEVGEGTYVYTALGWYRQLKQYNPGAYRFFANLVSLPLTRGNAGR